MFDWPFLGSKSNASGSVRHVILELQRFTLNPDLYRVVLSTKLSIYLASRNKINHVRFSFFNLNPDLDYQILMAIRRRFTCSN